MSVISVNLPVSILKEGKYFVAYSTALDLATSGKTFEEARRRFTEVVEIFFEELAEKGTTDKVLTSLGWGKLEGRMVPPVEVSHKLEDIKVPLTV